MSDNRLFVRNLSYSVTNEQLKELLEEYGTVKSVNIIEGKGFGFIEMASQEEAEKVLESLNEVEFEGRNLNIEEYVERPRKSKRES